MSGRIHYPANTVSVSRWCKTEGKFTQHRVSGNVATHCIPCAEKQEQEVKHRQAAAIPPAAVQTNLFASGGK